MTRSWLRSNLLRDVPPDTFCQADRTGRMLFVCRIDEDRARRLADEGWTVDLSVSPARIAPGIRQLAEIREALLPQFALSPFSERENDPDVLPLFCAMLRAVFNPPASSAINALDKQLRQAMAVALRAHRGGGLEVCAALFRSFSDPDGRIFKDIHRIH